MIWTPLFAVLTAFVGTLYAALPPFVYTLYDSAGDIGQGGFENGAFAVFIQYLGILDRWLPLHDFVIPAFAMSFYLMAALLAFKLIKFSISCVPTISASG